MKPVRDICVNFMTEALELNGLVVAFIEGVGGDIARLIKINRKVNGTLVFRIGRGEVSA